jgi:hypothetical protein
MESLIRNIKVLFENENINEGLSRAKELYLDTRKVRPDIFKKLIAFDPTLQLNPTTKQYVGKGKYIEWMARMYAKRKIPAAQIGSLEIIKIFDNLLQKNIVPVESRDINRFQSVEQLDDIVRRHEKTVTGSEIKKGVKDVADVDPKDIVFNGEFAVVVDPKNVDTSCKYGKGSKWCTAAYKGERNYFEDYYLHRKVKLYYIIPKIDMKNQKYEKIAVAVSLDGRKEYFDYFDDHIEPATFSKIRAKLDLPV